MALLDIAYFVPPCRGRPILNRSGPSFVIGNHSGAYPHRR